MRQGLVLGPVAVAAWALLAAPASAQQPAGEPVVAIKAAKICPVSRAPIDNGVILVRGRKIVALGTAKEIAIPAGATVLDAGEGWACPGFVDLHNHIGGMMWDINDMVHPTNPELSTLPTIDPENWLLQRAMRWGVTTVLYIPGSGTNLSGFGTLMKTHGRTPEEWLVRFPGAMKVAQGYNPERWAGDLGASRMGMWWALERTLDRGKAYADAWARHGRGEGAAPAPDAELEMLRGLFEKKYPVIVHTAGARDIMGTVRMFKDHYDLKVILSHGCFDAYKAAEAVAKSGLPLNLGPRTYDLYFNTEAKVQPVGMDYLRAGVVRFSVNTDAPVIPCEEFFLQATMTCRLGVDIATALRALTLEPAEAVGIAAECGSLDVGKDADIFCTSGNPLDPRSRPLFVLVRGAVGFDHGRPGDDRLPVPRTAAEAAPDVRFHHDEADALDAHPGHTHGDLTPGEACPECGAFDAEKARFAKRLGAPRDGR